jgi:hypothetical protein
MDFSAFTSVLHVEQVNVWRNSSQRLLLKHLPIHLRCTRIEHEAQIAKCCLQLIVLEQVAQLKTTFSDMAQIFEVQTT